MAMIGETMTLDGGNKNGTLMDGPIVGGNGESPIGVVMGEEGGYFS